MSENLKSGDSPMLLLEHDKLYFKLGTHKMVHFVNPRVIDASTFVFPLNTMLHWLNISDAIAPLTREYGYLVNMDRVFVKTIFSYNDDACLGAFRHTNQRSETNIINDLIASEKTFKFIKPNVHDLPIPNKTLLVINYGALNARYIYNSNVLNRYYKWYNPYQKMTTQLMQANYRTDRNRYVTINIPSKLPSRVQLDKFANKIISGYLDDIPTYEYFNLIDLWRFLSPDIKEHSLLTNIPVEEYKNTTLMLIMDTKVALLNLNVLYSIVKEYGAVTKLQQLPAASAKKLFYLFICRIVEAASESYDTLLNKEDDPTSDVSININNITGVDDLAISVKNTSVVLDDELNKHPETEFLLAASKRNTDGNSDVDVVDEFDDVEITTNEISEIADTANNKKYTSKQEIYSEPMDTRGKIANEIVALNTYGVMSKNEMVRLHTILEEQPNKPSPYPGDNRTVGQLLDTNTDSYAITPESVNINADDVIKDKRIYRDWVTAFNKKYLQQQYKKDITRTIYALQSAGVVIEDYSVYENASILGATEEHVIKVKTLNGSPSVMKLTLPKIDEEANFKLSGNTYRVRMQRADLPLRKISNTEVGLTSYYGKYFISKATAKKNDIGYWIRNIIISLYEEQGVIKDLVIYSNNNFDCNVPNIYSYIARYIKSFRYNEAVFDFEYVKRVKLFNNLSPEEIVEIEANGTIVGSSNGNPIIIDSDEKLWVYNNNSFTEMEDFYTIFNIDKNDMPSEFISIRIYNKSLPVVLLLSYYLGLENLMIALGTKYTLVERNYKNKDTSKMLFIFKDKALLIDKDHSDGELILAGLMALKDVTSITDYELFTERSGYDVIFTKLELPLLYRNEIRLLETLYVDPITETVLKEMDEPTNFKGLLLRSAEILVNDNYLNPNNINGMCIKGYERIAGMTYKRLVQALKEHENRTHFSKSKMLINTRSVIQAIGEDSTTVLIDDLNPIAVLKQTEDVTYLGEFGRSKDSMSKDTRSLHESEIGIMSEASKDSGDVGISAYLSAAPKIKNIRGFIDTFDFKKDGISSVLSTSAMLAGFAQTDDPKRLNKLGRLYGNVQC